MTWRDVGATIGMWASVAAYAAWGWQRMKRHPPGLWRLTYWILMLFLIHMAIARGW